MNLIKQDILNSNEQYIAHQCNCVSNYAAGLADVIFQSFPYANIYAMRNSPSIPGTIDVRHGERNIINMFAQFYPGTPTYPNSNKDGYKARERYFEICLLEISKIQNIKSIAFPYLIGCGLAGGDWNNYLNMILDFAEKNSQIEINIYEKT